MASGISIGVGADTREFSQAVSRGVVQPLEGVTDALQDVSRDGDRAGDRLTDAMRDAQRQTTRLEDAHERLGDVIVGEARRGARAVRENSEESTSVARRNLDEVADEGRSNLSEVVSSFDGSMESVADLVQGTLGGVVSSLGPLGAAVGAAGALAVGAVMGLMNQAGETTEAYKERVSALGQEFITAGLNGETSIDYLVDKLAELATETESVSLKELAKTAKDSGGDFRDLAQAYAGNTRGLRELWRAADDRLAQSQLEIRAAEQSGRASSDELRAMQQKIDAQGRYRDYVGQSIGASKEAAEAERNYVEAGGRAMETRAAAADTYQSELDEAVGAFDDFRNAETGALDPAAYLAGIQARIDATANFNSNVQTLATQFGLTDAEVQSILDQGLDFAPMLQSIKDAGLEGEFVEKLRTAVGGGQEILDGADLKTTTEVDADTGKAEDVTEAFTNTKRETTIDTKANTKQAEDRIRAVANARYAATIDVDAALSAAQASVDRFARRNRTITITADIVDRAGRPVD
jgi:hypothetical protein